LLELNGRLRSWIERRVALQRPPKFTLPTWARYLVLFGSIGVAATAGYNVFAFVLPYAGMARDWHFVIYGASAGFGLFFLVTLIMVELLIAPRLWCRSLCPTGLLLETLGRRRVFGLQKASQPPCPSGCHACITACPVGVIPRDGHHTESCMLCSACVDRCPTSALSLGAALPKRRQAWRHAVGAVALLVILGTAGSAAAHHIKGQPHYGYLENYPQTPTREQRFTASPYLITVVAFGFDGMKAARSETPNDVMIYISARHERTKKGYRGPLEVKFRDVVGGPVITRRFKFPVEETVYRMRVTLPAPAYDIAINLKGAGIDATTRLDVRGVPISLPLYFLAGVAAILIGIVAFLGIRHRRRRARVDLATAPSES
jgi:ferredoxin